MSLQLSLEQQEVQLVLVALGKLPLENSLDTWAKIRNQAESQLQAAAAASAPTAPTAPTAPVTAAPAPVPADGPAGQ